jgi:hypothetical protein
LLFVRGKNLAFSSSCALTRVIAESPATLAFTMDYRSVKKQFIPETGDNCDLY